jgi:hypothetical protein
MIFGSQAQWGFVGFAKNILSQKSTGRPDLSMRK